MKREAVIQQVLALRSAAVTVVTQADALLYALEPEEEEATAPAAGGCAHPEDKRESTATGANPHSFFCHACKKTSDEIEAEKAGGS